jgi:hypothetical protein
LTQWNTIHPSRSGPSRKKKKTGIESGENESRKKKKNGGEAMKKENLIKKNTKGRRRSTLTTGYIKSYSTTPAFFICLFEKKKNVN